MIKRMTVLVLSAAILLTAAPCAAWAADEPETSVQIAKMLLARARDDYEIVAKAKATNRGFLERLEAQLQPYLERREGELVYNFRKAPTGIAPTMTELNNWVEWHENAVKRHFFYTEEGIRTGVKLNDALNRMEDVAPVVEDTHAEELEQE